MTELKFALECGVKVEVKELSNGEVQVSWNNGNAVEIMTNGEAVELGLVTEEASTEMSEAEALQAWATTGTAITVEKQVKVVHNPTKDMTDKEFTVLLAMSKQFNAIEGLPIDTELVAEETGYTTRTVVGVVSSLYKKGYVERYDFDTDMFTGKVMTQEYIVTDYAKERLERLGF